MGTVLAGTNAAGSALSCQHTHIPTWVCDPRWAQIERRWSASRTDRFQTNAAREFRCEDPEALSFSEQGRVGYVGKVVTTH